jgi:two-component system, sporulation sensor kinase E
MKSGFMDKLIDRLDRIDPKSLQTHFLRLAQEKGLIETIFQSIQEGIIVIDGSGRLTYANKAAEHLMGFSTETAQGRPVSNYLRNIDWNDILKFDENEWTKLITREIEITYPEHKFVAFYVVPLSQAQNAEKGAVVILRDVTPDRAHETTVLESERINAIKLLAAGVAHEIGNPINALNIHLQLLDRGIDKLAKGDKKNLKELVGVAKNEMARLDMIVSQFLRAVRPAKPKFALHKIENILKDTLALLKQEILNRDIDIDVRCEESLPRTNVDKDQIKQAFVNIIRNAFQAMPDGGKLSISLSNSDQFVKVSFRDTGVGIKPENLGRIFEPYYSTKSEGNGLGLMIVQRIVQDHGGRLEVVSKQDEGTVFTIFLPLGERRIKLLTRGED